MIYIRDYQAEGPFDLNCKISMLRRESGIYVVLHKKEDGNYNVIDVGSADSVKDKLEHHERENCWKGFSTSIFVAPIYLDRNQLREVETRLKKIYKPPCSSV